MRKLTKMIAIVLVIASVLSLNPIEAHAEWRKNNKGWWFTEGNSWTIGWKLIDKDWYYFDSNGYMKTGWIYDRGNWYYAYGDGSMAYNTTIDGYYLNSTGAWTESASTILSREILKNVSVQNPSFNITCSSSDVSLKSVGDVIKDEISKLKITNPYEMLNVTKYTFSMSSYGGNIKVKINCTYKMTAGMETELDKKAKEIVASIVSNSMSASEKERVIHDWIVNNTKYDESYSIYDPYNTLFKHTGVCQGYALLAQKMFTIAGIKSIVVSGTGNGQAHAWNMVYINGQWRHVDCTWDDPVSSRDVLQYDYYNLTDKQMSKDHSWDTTAYPKAN